MNIVAIVAILVSAAMLVVVAPIEMVAIGRPWAQKFLGIAPTDVRDVELWSFCIGFRNLLAAAGAVIGLVILVYGDEVVGRTVMMTTAWYMLLSSLAMGLADLVGRWHPRGGSVKGTIASSVLPLLAIVVEAL